jgi:hypothetical protein
VPRVFRPGMAVALHPTSKDVGHPPLLLLRPCYIDGYLYDLLQLKEMADFFNIFL